MSPTLEGFPHTHTHTQLLMRQFARARQMQTGTAPASAWGLVSRQTGLRGTLGVNMWHIGVPKAWLVASICFSKSSSSSFTHVAPDLRVEVGGRDGEYVLCLVPHRARSHIIAIPGPKCTLQLKELGPLHSGQNLPSVQRVRIKISLSLSWVLKTGLVQD